MSKKRNKNKRKKEVKKKAALKVVENNVVNLHENEDFPMVKIPIYFHNQDIYVNHNQEELAAFVLLDNKQQVIDFAFSKSAVSNQLPRNLVSANNSRVDRMFAFASWQSMNISETDHEYHLYQGYVRACGHFQTMNKFVGLSEEEE